MPALPAASRYSESRNSMSAVALGAAHRGQADPEHRHALGFQDGDHLLDLLAVELDPALVAEFVEAVRRSARSSPARRSAARRRRRHRPAAVGIGRLVVGLGGGVGRAVRLRPGLASPGLASAWRGRLSCRPSCRSVLSALSAAGSRIATRSLRPSMTTMASGFSVARMPLAAAAQSAGSPLGWYLIRPETVLCLRITPMSGCSA